MLKKLKKWNWGVFSFFLLISAIGATGNKSVENFWSGLLLVLGLGLPFGLLWAWMMRDDD